MLGPAGLINDSKSSVSNNHDRVRRAPGSTEYAPPRLTSALLPTYIKPGFSCISDVIPKQRARELPTFIFSQKSGQELVGLVGVVF